MFASMFPGSWCAPAAGPTGAETIAHGFLDRTTCSCPVVLIVIVVITAPSRTQRVPRLCNALDLLSRAISRTLRYMKHRECGAGAAAAERERTWAVRGWQRLCARRGHACKGITFPLRSPRNAATRRGSGGRCRPARAIARHFIHLSFGDIERDLRADLGPIARNDEVRSSHRRLAHVLASESSGNEKLRLSPAAYRSVVVGTAISIPLRA